MKNRGDEQRPTRIETEKKQYRHTETLENT